LRQTKAVLKTRRRVYPKRFLSHFRKLFGLIDKTARESLFGKIRAIEPSFPLCMELRAPGKKGAHARSEQISAAS
jgi:hypothetical protein